MSPPILLALASLGLLVGPTCEAIGSRARTVQSLVDGFSLALIGGLCLGFVLPHTMEELGPVAIALAAAGAVAPFAAHRLWAARAPTLALVVLAIGGHVALDGAALAVPQEDGPLGWAVVAHRLPEGFAIVMAAQAAARPARWCWALALLMVGITLAGYFAGAGMLSRLPESAPPILEAVMAGVLLHVVFAPHAHHHAHGEHGHAEHHHAEHPHAGHHHAEHHHATHRHHVHEASADTKSETWWSAWGALGGLLALLGWAMLAHPHAAERSLPGFLGTLGVLVLESAPALLVGYALAGAMPFLLTPARTSSLARGGSLVQALRGVSFGLPLPVCSCGVLPLYESLIRRGAPPAAAMAFFVATPELGLDAVLLSFPLLGSSLALARVVSAFLVALLVGLLVSRGVERRPIADAQSARLPSESGAARLRAGLRFGFVDVFDHTMPWIALGLIVAAMAEPMLSHGAIEHIQPALQVPLAALIGVPVYVCASGATPIAAMAIHKGLSSGAAIAFLIAGPATNITTFGVLARLHGRRTALAFGVAVTSLAIVAGWAVDALGIPAAAVLEAHAAAQDHGSWLGWACVVGLAGLALASLFRQGPRGALRQIVQPIHAH